MTKILQESIRCILNETVGWSDSLESISLRLEELIGKEFSMFKHLEKMGWKLGRFLPDTIPHDFVYLGSGMYRVVFAPKSDKDLVIKIAKTEDGCAMNSDDALVGKNGYWAKAFPKCYNVADDYRWIIQERCDVARNRSSHGYADLSSYFVNTYFYYFSDDDEWSVLICSLAIGAGMSFDELKKSCRNAYLTAANEINNSFEEDPDEIIQSMNDELMNTSATYKLWCGAIKRFGIAPDDLYSNNLGFSREDCRPVIIDSSFINTLERT